MAVTRAFLNESTETAESVNIKPFDRASWSEIDANVFDNAITSYEHRIIGQEPEYPLVRRTAVRNATVFHPDYQDMKMSGRNRTVEIHTVMKYEDTTIGVTRYIPYRFTVGIASGDVAMPLPAEALQMLLSTCAELWDSVTTGTPDTAVMNKLAVGSADL